MGVYYTSVKRTQQLSGVTRIRTHDLLIRYLITKHNFFPVLYVLFLHMTVQYTDFMRQPHYTTPIFSSKEYDLVG